MDFMNGKDVVVEEPRLEDREAPRRRGNTIIAALLFLSVFTLGYSEGDVVHDISKFAIMCFFAVFTVSIVIDCMYRERFRGVVGLFVSAIALSLLIGFIFSRTQYIVIGGDDDGNVISQSRAIDLFVMCVYTLSLGFETFDIMCAGASKIRLIWRGEFGVLLPRTAAPPVPPAPLST